MPEVEKVSRIVEFFLRRFALVSVLALKKVGLSSELYCASIDAQILGGHRAKNIPLKWGFGRLLRLVRAGDRKRWPDQPLKLNMNQWRMQFWAHPKLLWASTDTRANRRRKNSNMRLSFLSHETSHVGKIAKILPINRRFFLEVCSYRICEICLPFSSIFDTFFRFSIVSYRARNGPLFSCPTRSGPNIQKMPIEFFSTCFSEKDN